MTGRAVTHPPADDLRAYALGDLPYPAAGEVDAHLAACEACRARVWAARAELVRLTEALPPLEPQAASWERVRRRVRPAPPRPWLVAAALALLALGGWGLWQQRLSVGLRAEQQVISGWLARPDVTLVTLLGAARQPSGRVLLAADRTALFVLPPAPPGEVYHAWVGLKRGWKPGDPLRLARSSTGGVFQAEVGDSDYLCLSLERDPAPTQPTHLLGWASL